MFRARPKSRITGSPSVLNFQGELSGFGSIAGGTGVFDQDYYSIDLTEGDRLQVTLFTPPGRGLFPGDGAVDAALQLIDADESTVIATSTDLFLIDPFIDYTVEADGTYFIRIFDENDCCAGSYRFVATVRD